MGKILILTLASIMVSLCIVALVLGSDTSNGIYNAIQVLTSLVIGVYAMDDIYNSDDN